MIGHRLFVYGTLRKGSIAERAIWLEQRGVYAGPARIRGRLYRLTDYPALAPPRTADDWVQGDLYTDLPLAILIDLDEHEGLEYQRTLAQIETASGEWRHAFVYRYAGPTAGLELIQSGDWKEFNRSSFGPG